MGTIEEGARGEGGRNGIDGKAGGRNLLSYSSLSRY